MSGVGEARKWAEKLVKYRVPSTGRGIGELLLTALPFVTLWAAAWYALS
jgi:omega-6 fatty acid desaturase (delta-12 desaturase)